MRSKSYFFSSCPLRSESCSPIGGQIRRQFKRYSDEENVAGLDGEEIEFVPIKLLHAHMDLFYNKCCALGRISEANLNGHIAVRCHGYTTTSADVEEELEQKFGVTAWNRPEEEYAKPSNERQPFPTIVKDLICHNTPFTKKLPSKVLKD